MKLAIKPHVISGLRNEFHYTLDAFAVKTKIDKSELQLWESEESEISTTQLKAMAKAFNCHWSVFLHENTVAKIKKPKSFRRSYGANHVSDSAPLVIAYQNANRVLDYSEDLGFEELSDLLLSTQTTTADPEALARQFRATLEVDNKEIKPSKAYPYWRGKVESLGVYVSEQELADSDVKAFSLIRGKRAIIVINKEDYYANSKLFSLLHETAHLLLGESASCNLIESKGVASPYINRVEKFCNTFAGAVLLPAEFVKNDATLARLTAQELSISDEWVKSMVSRYRVSFPVVLGRLCALQYIPKPEYHNRLHAYISLAAKHKREQREKNKGKEIKLGRRFHLQKAIDRNSVLFTRELIALNQAQRLSYGELTKYLNVSGGQLSGIKELLGYD